MPQLFYQRNQESGADLSGFHGIVLVRSLQGAGGGGAQSGAVDSSGKTVSDARRIYRNVFVNDSHVGVGGAVCPVPEKTASAGAPVLSALPFVCGLCGSGMDCDRPGLRTGRGKSAYRSSHPAATLCGAAQSVVFMAYGRTKEWKRVLERLRRIEWGRLHRGGM